ncbi:MAG TPA: 3-hydroxyacyl-CoA dehydrogenase NAD-binding domain-containing protein [Dehalococcoidales bacterium]|nr:3-hydroxyacyl-CoA dehydrogenase NAD-binding domain-containing protein [Dehalococcoidales bacterium]
MKEIKNVTVLGAGGMGAQIAALAAEAGYNVKIRDIQDKFLERGRQIINEMYDKRISRGRLTEAAKKDYLGRVKFLVDLKEAVKDADIIIEAVPEIMDLKKSVLKEVTALCPADCVFATNTSSLSISEIATAAKRPEMVVGTHYFNPPSRMSLLEIVHGEKTGQPAVEIAEKVAIAMGRDVVHVTDVPGFVANRIFCNMANEADWAVAQGEAKSPLEVDAAIKYKLGLPMGMLELQDILGGGSIDTQFHVMEYFGATMGKSYGPAPILARLFKEGNYGKKTGKGYYDWSGGKANEIPMNAGVEFDPVRVLAGSVNEAAKLLEMKATTREEIDTAVLLGLNFPRGVLRMADSAGLDNVLNELNRLYDKYKEDRYKACPVLTKLVRQGKLGRKTGRGFYSYGPGEYEFVKLNIDKKTGVARLILNRPNRANAFNADFMAEINKALNELESNQDARCVVITGAGANFCGGADLAAFASGEVDAAFNFSEAPHAVFTRIETYPRPVIAAINGPAIGGGLELALACDIRIMSTKAALRLPEITLGLLPGAGATQRLGRLIGWARAKEIVLLADPVDAARALDWGLVNFTAEPEEFDKMVDEIAVRLAGGAPLAQKLAKGLLYYGAQADQRTALYLEAAVSGDIAMTGDLNEGITAMFYRRPPKFKGK